MQNRKWRHSNDYLRSMMLPLVIFLCFVIFLIAGLSGARKSASAESLEMIGQSVMRATVQCYAIEGMYPPDVAYLEKNYGIIIDHDKYIVHYEAFASNILPDIIVLDKETMGGGGVDR